MKKFYFKDFKTFEKISFLLSEEFEIGIRETYEWVAKSAGFTHYQQMRIFFGKDISNQYESFSTDQFKQFISQIHIMKGSFTDKELTAKLISQLKPESIKDLKVNIA